MTDETREPNDRLELWLLFELENEAGEAPSTRPPAALLEAIRRRDAEERRRRRLIRRRARWGGIAGVALVATGGVAAASLFREQPRAPEGGVACRGTVNPTGGVVIAIGTVVDPIEGCRDVWESGRFGLVDSIPPLTACIGLHGLIEVFPAEQGVCEELGLAVADSELSPENAAIVALQDRLVEEINALDCQPVPDVLVAAKRIVADAGFDDWNVIISPGVPEDGPCGKVGVDSSTRTVFVFTLG